MCFPSPRRIDVSLPGRAGRLHLTPTTHVYRALSRGYPINPRSASGLEHVAYGMPPRLYLVSGKYPVPQGTVRANEPREPLPDPSQQVSRQESYPAPSTQVYSFSGASTEPVPPPQYRKWGPAPDRELEGKQWGKPRSGGHRPFVPRTDHGAEIQCCLGVLPRLAPSRLNLRRGNDFAPRVLSVLY